MAVTLAAESLTVAVQPLGGEPMGALRIAGDELLKPPPVATSPAGQFAVADPTPVTATETAVLLTWEPWLPCVPRAP